MSQDNHSKDYLVSIMFSHYDKNNNGNVETTELNEVKRELISFRDSPDIKSFFLFHPHSQWDSFCVITWCCGTVPEWWSIFVACENIGGFLIKLCGSVHNWNVVWNGSKGIEEFCFFFCFVR